jgi:hypothetical protein
MVSNALPKKPAKRKAPPRKARKARTQADDDDDYEPEAELPALPDVFAAAVSAQTAGGPSNRPLAAPVTGLGHALGATLADTAPGVGTVTAGPVASEAESAVNGNPALSARMVVDDEEDSDDGLLGIELRPRTESA